ncbi:MAG: hypothetical protein MUF45_08150 [Spirosomaceae bacterium]|jgi:hypothetical protein|nr:hypothetical protein [Spirosomataceae bacterium]
MKTLSIFALLLTSSVLMAQNVDSTKTKKDSVVVPPRQSNYFDKYKKSNSTPKATSNEPNLNLKKSEQKQIESNYIIEDNRVQGGSTTIKFGDKNKKKKN